MSDTVMSTGFFAVLKTTLNQEDRDEKSELMYDENSDLQINYDGTLVYSDTRSDNYYGLVINTGRKPSGDGQAEFIIECERMNLDIDESTIRSYACTWYNGCDSDMAMLSLEKYMKEIT